MSAFILAEKHELYGIEGDVQISKDGVPFLMHDSTLLRTTNVREMYPKRSTGNIHLLQYNFPDKASHFTWKELQELDGGSWFSKEYSGEKIPSLKDVLNFLKSSNLLFIFDLKMPHASHPYYSTFKEIVVKEINSSGASEKVILFSL